MVPHETRIRLPLILFKALTIPTFLSSTLSILRRKGERIHQALKEHSWDFYHIGFGR